MVGQFRKVSLLFLLCIVSLIASANPVPFQWLEVPADSLSIDELRLLPDSQWQSIKAGGNLNQGFSDGDFWLKVALPSHKVNHFLEISYPLLDEVSVHWEALGRIIETHHTGDTLAFNSRPIVHRNFVFVVPVTSGPVTAWIRVRTSGSVQVPISVTPSAKFLADEQVSFGWQAMFFGIVVSLALYNLILFILVRHITYLLYVLAIVSSALVQLNFNGLLFQWIWPNYPQMNQYFTVSAVGLTLVFVLTFTMKFLVLRQFSVGGYRVLQIFRIVALFLVIYGFFGSYQLGIVMASAMAALTTPVVWLIGLLVWRKGQILAGFYVLAWTPFLIGHLALAISKLGLMTRNSFTELAPQAGVALEAILLSFALAYRINMERQRRQQIQHEATLTLETRVQERTEELQKANDKLRAVSLTDGLTRVANRRRFDEKLDDEWLRTMRHRQLLGLIIVDIDHFKSVNDTWGHLTGDDCLVRVADVINSEVQRSGDLLARFGGEEFVVLLPDTTSGGALFVAEQIRKAIEQSQVDIGENMKPVKLTVSVGVATLIPSQGASKQDLIRYADEALYKAKTTGRNRVVVWNENQ